MRSSQIPDEWVNKWCDELNKTGTLSLDYYAQIVILTDEQREENIDSDAVLNSIVGVWWGILNNQGLLHFYLKLDSTERALLFSDTGLDAHMLNQTQRQLYTEMFHNGSRWTWGA